MARTSTNWRIFRDTLLVGGITSVVKIAGTAKVMVSARFFGAGDALDAYLIAFLIPSFVSDVMSGSLGPSLIPLLIETRERSGFAAAERLYSTVLISGVALLSAVALVLAIVSTPVIHLLGSAFDPAKLQLTRSLFFIMIPILPLTALSCTSRAVLNAQERFAMAAVTPLLTPAAIIVFLYLFASKWGPYAIAYGTLTGCVLEAACLLPSVLAIGYLPFRRHPERTATTDRVARQYASVAFGNLIMGGSSVVDQAMASMLGGGSVSVLNFGTRLVTVVLAVGPAALSTSILPRFSRMTATGDSAGLRHTLKTYILLCAAITIPMTALLIYFSHPLTHLFFQRGAFTSADTNVVARIQVFALLQIPSAVLLGLLIRLVSSLKANELLVGVAAISLVLNVALNFLLMRPLGVAGIALSTSIVHLVALVLISYLVHREVRSFALSRPNHVFSHART